MRRPVRGLGLALVVLSLLAGACSSSESAESDCCRLTLVDFEDVMPEGTRLGLSWHGIGIDHLGRVYVGLSTGDDRRGSVGDVLLFEYDTRTGGKRFLGSLRSVLRDEGNLGPNFYWPKPEAVSKVHSDILEFNGVLYFSTHGWHGMADFDTERGAHILSYDPASGEFSDLSRDDPQGVAVVREGIIALAALGRRYELVGWTYPWGNIVIHDLANGQSRSYTRGLPLQAEANIARKVIATRTGEVYAAYSRSDEVPGSAQLFKLDRAAGRLRPTGQSFHGESRFEGLAQTSDGDTFYLAGTDGILHAFDVESERLRSLGSALPPEAVAAGATMRHLYNLALSRDERKLFTLPADVAGGDAYHLYEADLASGDRSDLGDFSDLLEGSVLSGNGVFDDQDRYYLVYAWPENRAGLLQIDVSQRVRPPPPTPVVEPFGGRFDGPVSVSLSAGASGDRIHYTTDGSDPGEGSPEFTAPFSLARSAIVRARAFRDGAVRSRAVETVFVLNGALP